MLPNTYEIVVKFAGKSEGSERASPTSEKWLNFESVATHQMASRGYEMTRYSDDLVIQCRTREEADTALELVRIWTALRGLTLHPTKTKIVHVDEGRL